MLENLLHLESTLIEALLSRMRAGELEFHSLKIRYETPHVDRIWVPLEDGSRLNFHRIYPCEKPLLHPHPWPSAVMVVSGSYEMEMGFANPDLLVTPPVAATVLMKPGSSYEMTHPWGWHSVRPLKGPSLSYMITGKPWPSDFDHPGKDVEHEKLDSLEIKMLLDEFWYIRPPT
jgi:hypothetical protein